MCWNYANEESVNVLNEQIQQDQVLDEKKYREREQRKEERCLRGLDIPYVATIPSPFRIYDQLGVVRTTEGAKCVCSCIRVRNVARTCISAPMFHHVDIDKSAVEKQKVLHSMDQ